MGLKKVRDKIHSGSLNDFLVSELVICLEVATEWQPDAQQPIVSWPKLSYLFVPKKKLKWVS